MTKVLQRCAIYTRKSSDEGLEQSFNSLDAQREAGEAYVKSQASEGWKALPARYDDGGFSGGTMERPGWHCQSNGARISRSGSSSFLRPLRTPSSAFCTSNVLKSWAEIPPDFPASQSERTRFWLV